MNSLQKQALINTLQGVFLVLGAVGYLFLLIKMGEHFNSILPIIVGIFGPASVGFVVLAYLNELNRLEQLERSKKESGDKK